MSIARPGAHYRALEDLHRDVREGVGEQRGTAELGEVASGQEVSVTSEMRTEVNVAPPRQPAVTLASRVRNGSGSG